MILVDSCVWIDHLRQSDAGLVHALQADLVLCHPFIIGELACGSLRQRSRVLTAFKAMPSASVATHNEALVFLDKRHLAGRGIGWIDLHLLASAALTGARLWTRDKRLAATASDLDLGLDYVVGPR